MSYGTVFSAVVKPQKPLLYMCDESTHITNIAVCPVSTNNKKNPQPSNTIAPFLSILKLQYEGPVIEGEKDDEDAVDKENAKSKKPNGINQSNKKSQKPSDDDDDDDDDYEDSDTVDIEAKEVVIGCFTPNNLQLTTDLYLAPEDQYRFVLSGSQDYEIHLLGRYIPDLHDNMESDEDDFDDDEDDDLYLDGIPTDEEASDDERIKEIDDDEEDEEVTKKALKHNKAIASGASKDQIKLNKANEDKKSNKRPLEDKDIEADTSMADSTASAADGTSKLSKSQRKKLKKNKLVEEAKVKDANGEGKTTDTDKAAPETKADAPLSKPTAPSTVTLPSGLKIIDTKIGEGPDAKPGQTVAMRYIGKLPNGKVFDSNTKGKPFRFDLGRGQVIKGWDEGIKGMKLGGERKLIVPANLGYGKSGAPPSIPPNSTLNFEVKLLAMK